MATNTERKHARRTLGRARPLKLAAYAPGNDGGAQEQREE